MTVYAYDATSTGYYLPKGYKVSAKVSVPAPPFWPGETLGDIVGISTSDYSVLVIGYGSKGGVLEGFKVEQGIKVVWKQAGREEVKATVTIQNVGEHDVTIVYGYDGQIKISVNGKFVHSFVANKDKYEIVAQGASVSAPEVLPTSDNSNQNTSDSGTGEGYNPPSVSELQMQYLLFGAGAVIVVVLVLVLMRRR
jgi:hypothetical protein